MWHADHEHSEEEMEVLRELEYDLFMYNPGFRSMWNDDFEAYFKSLFNEQVWEEKLEERLEKIEGNMSHKMIQDPEFAEFMKRQALIDSVLFGDLAIEHAPIDIQEEVREIQQELEETDKDLEIRDMFGIKEFPEEPWQKHPLFKKAKDWGRSLHAALSPLYDTHPNKDIFRILNNCDLVSVKLISVLDPNDDFTQEDYEWRTDRIGLKLSLTSLQRCLESLERLSTLPELSQKIDTLNPIKIGKEIQQELIDKLDTIEQEHYKKV
jgi:hypothetical protein